MRQSTHTWVLIVTMGVAIARRGDGEDEVRSKVTR